jgi:4-hydroxy-tetrahydrodipicolinate synthase
LPANAVSGRGDLPRNESFIHHDVGLPVRFGRVNGSSLLESCRQQEGHDRVELYGSLLIVSERCDLLASDQILPIVLGLSHAATQAAVVRAKVLATLRPEGLLLTAPPYVQPTQQGIQRHFEAIAGASDLPILIYNIPYRTGVNVELETLQALARNPRVVGIKECGGSSDRMLRLVNETPLRVFSGDDNQNFVALCLRAHGTIAASAHVAPEVHVRVYHLIRDGRFAAARRLAVALQPMIRDLFAEPNPAPLKALLARQGWCPATVRLPFLPVGEELARQLLSHWDELRKLTQSE